MRRDVRYDVVVVGAGLWGSACARHLAEAGASVALVGPQEPAEAGAHHGAFASHYDAARITRRLDSTRDWSRFAAGAMARYSDLEARGQRGFFHRVGALMAGPETGVGSAYINDTHRVAEQEQLQFQALRGAQLAQRFPYLSFPAGVLALYEEDGGWINPRDHVAAAITAGVAQGVTLIRQQVVDIHEQSGGVAARCADGRDVFANHVVVACGAFSKTKALLPEPVPLTVYARTIAFFEIDAAEAARLRDMPSVIYILPGGTRDSYILPPVTYPDGKTYLKIGGDPEDVVLDSVAQMGDWFRGGGDPKVGTYLESVMRDLMPGLSYQNLSVGSCVTSFTPRGNPLIYQQSGRVFALTGGNGAGAKCADEIGRLAARAVLGDADFATGFDTDFRP